MVVGDLGHTLELLQTGRQAMDQVQKRKQGQQHREPLISLLLAQPLVLFPSNDALSLEAS